MPVFEISFKVNAPVAAVSAFHRDTRTLRLLTPPPMIVQLHQVDPLAEGSISTFTLWFGPLPIRWKAVHSEVDPASGFTDTQAEGPLLHWRHRHAWRPLDEKSTLMTERVEYQHHPGLQGALTKILFSTLGLKAMFLYRRLVIQLKVK
jgi:ligand-binding SRPBCC domain-containing protein